MNWRNKGEAWWLDAKGEMHPLAANQTHGQWLEQNADWLDRYMPGIEGIKEARMENGDPDDERYNHVEHAFKHGWKRVMRSGDRLLVHSDTGTGLTPPQARGLKDHAMAEHANQVVLFGKDGEEERPFRLARVKAPAGGQITGGGTETGGTFQQGGQFAAKARRRIRETVLAWLRNRVQLARKKPTGDLPLEDLRFGKTPQNPDPDKVIHQTPAADEAIHAAKKATGPAVPFSHEDKIRDRLTVGELKDVEKSLKLPSHLTLSNRHGNETRADADPVAPLDLDRYYEWANGVARHIQNTGMTRTALARLRDPKHLSKAKLAFITGRLAREANGAKAAFADTGGASKWYGDHVGAMTRHLHDTFHSGDPKDDEIWGKLDKKTGRVVGGAGITLAKLLVAATSGGMMPHENYDTAHAMIESGHDRAAGGVNPFKHIARNQDEEHAAWVKAVAKWHADHKTGVTRDDIIRPGVSLADRVKWYNRVMRPMVADPEGQKLNNGGTNSAARYSGMTVKYVDDPTSPHHLEPIGVKKGVGDEGWRSPYAVAEGVAPAMKPLHPNDKANLPTPPGEADYTAKLLAEYGKGKTRTEKIPAVDDAGKLVAPGWTSRNWQVLDGLDKINAVVKFFTDTSGGNARKGMTRAAAFFTNPQKEAAFAAIIGHIAKTDPHVAARLVKVVKDNRGFYYHDEELPGAFLLGPKFGAFSMNLHLDQPAGAGVTPEQHNERFGGHLTADLWWSRDWNTMLGSLFGENKTKGKRQETPRGGSSHPERKLMRKAAQQAAAAAGLNNVAELQAVLWYYEQQKPRWFGVDTSSTSYLDGVNLVAKRKGLKYHIHPKTGAIRVKGTT